MAGRRNRYTFREYRGRGGGRSVLVFIIALLAVLLIAGVDFMAFMSDYITYTPDGMEIHWPWMKEQETSAPPVFSDPVVIETDNIVVTVEPTPETARTPRTILAAVTVTADQLRDGTAAQAVADAGGNALVVDMKADTGLLAWQSQAELAASLLVNADDNSAADAIRELARIIESFLDTLSEEE